MATDQNLSEKFKDAPLNKETIREIVKEAVLKYGKDLTKEEKIEQAKVVIKMLEEGVNPYQTMRLTDQEIGNMYSYGYSLFNSGQYQDAASMFLYLLTIVPFNPTFSQGLAICYHKMKRYEEAAKYYTQAAAVDKNDPVPLFYAYGCYNELQDPLSCMEALAGVIARSKRDPKYATLQNKAQMIVESLYNDNPGMFVRLDKDEI